MILRERKRENGGKVVDSVKPPKTLNPCSVGSKEQRT